VTTSAAGSVIATIGKDTAWVVSDLGNPR
jgi:hypothetical protein